MNYLSIIFIVNLGLLYLHQLDATRRKEWKMFIILKDMPEEKAYVVFSLLQLPLLCLILFMFLQPVIYVHIVLYVLLDVFYVLHCVVHYVFKKHKNNRFDSRYSKLLINAMGWLGAIHLILLIFNPNLA